VVELLVEADAEGPAAAAADAPNGPAFALESASTAFADNDKNANAEATAIADYLKRKLPFVGLFLFNVKPPFIKANRYIFDNYHKYVTYLHKEMKLSNKYMKTLKVKFYIYNKTTVHVAIKQQCMHL
jgi:hypothetical protein